MMEEATAIPLSKGKLWVLLLLSCVFVAGGYWLWQRVPEYEGLDHYKAAFGALTCMTFFGLSIPVFVFKLADSRPGLVVNAIGIYRMGLWNYHAPIRWEHITHCTTHQVKRTKLLLIHVDNVEEEIAKLPSWLRWSQRLIVRSTGTPYSLSSAALRGDFNDLRTLIESRIALYRQTNRP